MDRKQRIISISTIVLSFIMIAVALFCIFASVGKQFGIFDRLLFPVTETPSTGIPDTTTAPPESGSGNNTNSPVTTPSDGTVTPPSTEIVGTPWILEKSFDAGKSYQDSLIFLGDSTTHGMVTYSVLSGGTTTKQVWCTKDNTLTYGYVNTIKIVYPETGEEMKISEAVALAKPSTMVITLGVTGGVSQNMEEEEFKEIYSKLLDSIIENSYSTKIILQSIFPVAKELKGEFSDKNLSNDRIIMTNKWIEQICEEYYRNGESVYYLDTFSVLVGSDGYLPAQYTNGDGLHMSPQGYNVILDNIRTHRIQDER